MKYIPTSLYRLQLTDSFSIADATEKLPYLKALGIEGVYCSPYFLAHSTHGYDIVDPNKINPKLATEKEYSKFCADLKKYKMFHLADVVPNHMGIYKENTRWQDVLERGVKSPYAKYFDLDWSQGKILVPLLSDDRVIEKENYCLVPWWTSATKTSYRRFFTINELIGIRIEDPEVLRWHHKLLFKLLNEKKIDGLRIDHPDGLLDPADYFRRLRKRHKGLILVEKILGFNERLPDSWDVDGTVGYEFAHMLTGLFVQKSKNLTSVYESFIGKKQEFDKILYKNKKSFLQKEMEGDLSNLVKLLNTKTKKNEIKSAIIELLSVFPVYRSYVEPKGSLSDSDRELIAKAIKKASKKVKRLKKVFEYLETVFFSKSHRNFTLKFQQLCAPAMAKGFEDITLYQYNRLLALNDVGFDPSRGGITKKEFHTFCQKKLKQYPYGILSSSTHDSKRSMDVRMLLATLSEIPKEWKELLKIFTSINARHKTKNYPDRNHEYFLYQIILGVWPSKPSFKRLWKVFQKSIRESREHTSWQNPNKEYEKACEHFLQSILEKSSPFTKILNDFYKKISKHGRYNSLSSVALKLGSPGIVDIYEGCERFKYSLVDPDNRTPINFEKKFDAKTELYKTALNFRKRHRELFLEGEYIPLKVSGKDAEKIIAFMRKKGDKHLIVSAILFTVKKADLSDTKIFFPEKIKTGVELFSKKSFTGKELTAKTLFSYNPFSWIFFKKKH